MQLYPKLKNQSKALTGLFTCQTAVLFYLAYFKYVGLAVTSYYLSAMNHHFF